uniref:Uncharacterized protein n=1 Tax=Meloidogyne javanica TaxID=6303 RepID=A0A915LPT6_MELJA
HRVSIVIYICQLDKYELNANRLYNMMIDQFSAFNCLFNNSLVKNLKDAEEDFGLGYPVLCIFKQSSEEFQSIIYQFKTTDKWEITREEFEVIEESRIHGEGSPNNMYNSYQLISSAYAKEQDDLVEKVQQHYINPQLVAQITYQLNNDALVYSPQLTQEIGVNEHPQQVREVYIPYPSSETTGNFGESSSQNDGNGNSDGGNGNDLTNDLSNLSINED